MLKARALIIGEKHALEELCLDRSARRAWSFSAVEETNVEKLKDLVASNCKPEITAIIVDGSEMQAKELTNALKELSQRGVTIIDIDDFYEKYLRKFNIYSKNGSAILEKEARSPLFEFTKRALDVLFGLMALVLLSPVSVLVSILIKLDSPGSILYLQRRVGLKNKEFTLYKFRTMIQGAEKDQAVWADQQDPRITKLGKLLRRLRVDELPQLINVLRGDMSIVGPRPERPEFVQVLRQKIPHYDVRHQVKPGLTGWAQVNFRYGASVDDAAEKLKYDLYYVKHRTILLDLLIMLKTVVVVIKGRGR